MICAQLILADDLSPKFQKVLILVWYTYIYGTVLRRQETVVALQLNMMAIHLISFGLAVSINLDVSTEVFFFTYQAI